jgi:hypothetical protein
MLLLDGGKFPQTRDRGRERGREHGRKKDANVNVDAVLYLLRWLNTFTFKFTLRLPHGR